MRPRVLQKTATGWLITQRSRIRILSSLPADTRPEGFAPGGCHAAREHGSTCQLSALPHGAAALSMTSANDGLHVWLPEALGPLIRASFVRTLRSRPQRKPVRFTSYAATTRMRRSRSNVLHSAHGSAYAAGQQHSLPPHTRKETGSIPAGTTHRLSAPISQRANGFEFMDFSSVRFLSGRKSTVLVHPVKVGGD